MRLGSWYRDTARERGEGGRGCIGADEEKVVFIAVTWG